MPKIGGPVGGAAEEVKKGVNNIARELGKSPEAVQECLNNVEKCALEIASAPIALTIEAYIESLYRQSEGKTYSFSPEFINLVQSHYEVSLPGVTWADVHTGLGMSVAYCDRIFFNSSGNVWTDRTHLHHVLHELEHVVQCQKRGKRTYLAEYILKGGMDAVKSGRLNVHDVHDFEIAANAKANALIDTLWNAIASCRVAMPAGAGVCRLPSGHELFGCACYGPAPAQSAPESRCASGHAVLQWCGGQCVYGAPPHRYVCG